MKLSGKFGLGLWLTGALALSALGAEESTNRVASFKDFDARARAGKTMEVVYLGGVLTWGANATDPETTSYRGLMNGYLRKKYFSANFKFHDAATDVGGSRLGLFRFERDVLAVHPDLVFLEFTFDDNPDGTDRPGLASYERLLFELVREGVPVVQVLIGSKSHFGPGWNPFGYQRLRDHLELGRLYRTAIGNSFPIINEVVQGSAILRDRIWPEGETFPSDEGHRLIFQAAQAGLDKAIVDGRICRRPDRPVFGEMYANRIQIFPAELPLPRGWTAEASFRSEGGDSISTHWNRRVAVCDAANTNAQPLTVSFTGSFFGLLGESDEKGMAYTVRVDGKPIPFREMRSGSVMEWPTTSSRTGGGRRFFWHDVSDKLQDQPHVMTLSPVFDGATAGGQLRVESICIAGGDLRARPF